MSDTVWIVGKSTSEKNERAWEFQGVFMLKEDAIAACRTQNYFVAPAKINVLLPDERFNWPGIIFPLWPLLEP